MTRRDPQDDHLIDAVLARLPDWQPPAGFAHRVATLATLATAEKADIPWIASVLRALGLAACVSVAAWLGGELFVAGLQSATVQEGPGPVSWLLAIGSLAVAWHCVRRSRPLARPPISGITS